MNAPRIPDHYRADLTAAGQTLRHADYPSAVAYCRQILYHFADMEGAPIHSDLSECLDYLAPVSYGSLDRAALLKAVQDEAGLAGGEEPTSPTFARNLYDFTTLVLTSKFDAPAAADIPSE